MKRIITTVFDIGVGLLGGCVIIGIVLFLNGVKPYVVLSGSMEPGIHTGSVCFVNEKADYEEIQTGDVIAYQLKTGNMVTHRVVSVTGKGIETKGDANEVSDGITTTRKNFKGKTLFSVPYLGYISRFMQSVIWRI